MTGKKYISSCNGKMIKTNTVFACLFFKKIEGYWVKKKTVLKIVRRPLCRSHAFML